MSPAEARTAGERPSHSCRRCRQRDWPWGNTTTAAAVVASFHSEEWIRCTFPWGSSFPSFFLLRWSGNNLNPFQSTKAPPKPLPLSKEPRPGVHQQRKIRAQVRSLYRPSTSLSRLPPSSLRIRRSRRSFPHFFLTHEAKWFISCVIFQVVELQQAVAYHRRKARARLAAVTTGWRIRAQAAPSPPPPLHPHCSCCIKRSNQQGHRQRHWQERQGCRRNLRLDRRRRQLLLFLSPLPLAPSIPPIARPWIIKYNLCPKWMGASIMNFG